MLGKVNIKMGTESTKIARASHEDSRALRVIQILSMLFLPASLVSSVFGMGFFNTSPGNDGQPVFVISGRWWWYIAISVPLTVICMLVLGGYNIMVRLKFGQGTALDMKPTWSEKAASKRDTEV